MNALGCTKVFVTAEEGADIYAEESKEAEVLGHLDAETEAWVILNEDQTWAKIYNEDEEAAAQYISMEDAAIKAEEDAEETKENTEDEKMAALGCAKIVVTAEEGADLYAEESKDADVLGHLDTETEAWVILNEDQTWAKIYSEDEEATAQYISMEDAVIKVEEIKEELDNTEEEFVLPENRSIDFDIFWDGEAVIGETAHFVAILEGYDGLDYTLQWQKSTDNANWENIEGENAATMDILATEEANELYYRVIVIIHTPEDYDSHEENDTQENSAQEYDSTEDSEDIQETEVSQE